MLTLTVVKLDALCAPLAGYAAYPRHCDRVGLLSIYGFSGGKPNMLGVGVTNAYGQVSFSTIFPAYYDGRWPHMHFEVFVPRQRDPWALGGADLPTDDAHSG